MKRHEILFLLCLINFSFCLYGNISYFTQAKTFGFCIFDSNIFLHVAGNDYIGNQTRLNAEKTAQTLSYDRKFGRLVRVLHFGANSVESDSRLDRITPPKCCCWLLLAELEDMDGYPPRVVMMISHHFFCLLFVFVLFKENCYYLFVVLNLLICRAGLCRCVV